MIPRTITPNLRCRLRIRPMREVVDSEGVGRLVVEREDPPPRRAIVRLDPLPEPPEFELPEGSEP